VVQSRESVEVSLGVVSRHNVCKGVDTPGLVESNLGDYEANVIAASC